MVHIRLWNRLCVRLAAATTLCSVLTLGLLLALVLQSQRRHLLEQAQRCSRGLWISSSCES